MAARRVLTDTGKIDLEIPRDRLATFDPQLIAKYQRRFPGFDDKIVSMYARGMSVREIQGHLRDLYGIEVSPDLVSAVTDAVLEEIAEWQNRPLEALYALVFFDAIRVKVRDEGTVRNKAVYLALGVRPDGAKEILGLWIEQSEGAKFWLRVMNELRTRGVEDVLIAVVDGLKGFPEAITAVFPETQVQTCIVHLIRSSLAFVSYKDRKAVAAALKEIYRAKDAEAGQAALEAFATSVWGRKYEAIAAVLAAQLDGGDPVLRLPRGGAPDHLHHQRHRGAECQTAPGGASPRALSHRRECVQAAVPGLEADAERVEDAATGVGHGQSPVRHSLRRPLQAGMMNPARTRKFRQSLGATFGIRTVLPSIWMPNWVRRVLRAVSATVTAWDAVCATARASSAASRAVVLASTASSAAPTAADETPTCTNAASTTDCMLFTACWARSTAATASA